MVPVAVYWGRAPQKEGSWLRLLFAEDWVLASRARKFLQVLFNGRNTLIEFDEPTSLRALLGADTFVLPAGGAADLPVRWTPDGDAPGCETQTRDLAIPFLRLGGQTARSARVLETIRTGRGAVSRTERVVPTPPKLDLDSTIRDWTCPRDFVRTACRAENTGTYEVVAEPRGEDACHFACRGPKTPGQRADCRFDATMDCALRCKP